MPESVGKILKHARESKQISLEEVSEKTRTPKKILSAIEEDKIHELSAGFYSKRFVKLYAQYLGALEQKVVHDYLSDIKDNREPVLVLKNKTEQAASDWFRKHKKQIGIGILAVFGIWAVLFGFNQIKKFAYEAFIRHKEKASIAAAARPQKKPQVAAVKQRTKRAVSPVDTRHAAIKPAAEKMVELEITAHFNTWVHVVGDETLLYRGILNKGTKDIWRAREEIKLELGNAGGVSLRLNGKNLGFPGKKGEKKSVIITKDGIKR